MGNHPSVLEMPEFAQLVDLYVKADKPGAFEKAQKMYPKMGYAELEEQVRTHFYNEPFFMWVLTKHYTDDLAKLIVMRGTPFWLPEIFAVIAYNGSLEFFEWFRVEYAQSGDSSGHFLFAPIGVAAELEKWDLFDLLIEIRLEMSVAYGAFARKENPLTKEEIIGGIVHNFVAKRLSILQNLYSHFGPDTFATFLAYKGFCVLEQAVESVESLRWIYSNCADMIPEKLPKISYLTRYLMRYRIQTNSESAAEAIEKAAIINAHHGTNL